MVNGPTKRAGSCCFIFPAALLHFCTMTPSQGQRDACNFKKTYKLLGCLGLFHSPSRAHENVSPMLQSGGQNQKRPKNRPSGYKTPVVWGGPRRFRAGDKISSGPEVGRLAICMYFFVFSKIV